MSMDYVLKSDDHPLFLLAFHGCGFLCYSRDAPVCGGRPADMCLALCQVQLPVGCAPPPGGQRRCGTSMEVMEVDLAGNAAPITEH